MDPAVMTMVNVMLLLVLVGYFLTREEDLPRRRPRDRRHGPRHWRRGPAHWPNTPRGPGGAGHP